MMMSAAKTLPYSAQPCAQLRYHPRPDLTPTDSATTRVRNEAPSPMNRPIKMFGTAAGIPPRELLNRGPAPGARAIPGVAARALGIPHAVYSETRDPTTNANNAPGFDLVARHNTST